jgi:hypothetical protein
MIPTEILVRIMVQCVLLIKSRNSELQNRVQTSECRDDERQVVGTLILSPLDQCRHTTQALEGSGQGFAEVAWP